MKKVLLRIEVLIVVGLLIAIWATTNAVGWTNTNSDVFWALFGFGAAVEGLIEFLFDESDE